MISGCVFGENNVDAYENPLAAPQNALLKKIFHATYLMKEKERAEMILLTITGALVIPARHRKEHWQDVYTARCKHFHWPSLNEKNSERKTIRQSPV